MSDMAEVREYINKLLAVGLKRPMNAAEEDHLKELIIAAHPGVDEICAALDELAASLDHVVLVQWRVSRRHDGRGEIIVGGTLEKGFVNLNQLLAAIRSLIPKPEPTVAEEWETVRQDLIRRGLVESNLGKAIARLRKRLENK